jgi:hypothetical protein
MAIIYDSERGWFIWSHSVDLCRKQCTPKQQYDWPYKAAFPKVFTETMTTHCPSGGAAFKNLSIERLPAENVDAYCNYKVRHWTAYSAVTLSGSDHSLLCSTGRRSNTAPATVGQWPECPPAVPWAALSVLLHFGTVIITAAWAASVAKWQRIGTPENFYI